MSSVPTNLIIAIILHPLLRGLRPSEAKFQFMVLAITRKTFFAIYSKTEGFRASESSSVPTNLMIVVILHPLLRGLRPSEAEIAKMAQRKWAWPCGAFSRNLKFRLLSFFDYTYKKRLTCKFIDFDKNLQILCHLCT